MRLIRLEVMLRSPSIISRKTGWRTKFRFFPVGLGAQANKVPGLSEGRGSPEPGFNLNRAGSLRFSPNSHDRWPRHHGRYSAR